MATVVIYRELAPAATPEQWRGPDRAQYIENSELLLRIARTDGNPAASLKLIEFIDLECPACRQFHRTTLARLREELGDELAISFVHLPLPNHRFAVLAATAAECAAAQGSVGRFVDGVLDLQDSIGLKPWVEYARRARVPGLSLFESCLAGGRAALVDSGLAAATHLNVRSTPTIILNGWRVPSPSEAELRRVIAALRKGEAPYHEAERLSLP